MLPSNQSIILKCDVIFRKKKKKREPQNEVVQPQQGLRSSTDPQHNGKGQSRHPSWAATPQEHI